MNSDVRTWVRTPNPLRERRWVKPLATTALRRMHCTTRITQYSMFAKTMLLVNNARVYTRATFNMPQSNAQCRCSVILNTRHVEVSLFLPVKRNYFISSPSRVYAPIVPISPPFLLPSSTVC